MKNSDRNVKAKCRWCLSDIEEGAKVCVKCSRNQNLFLQNLRHVGVGVSLILIVIAIGQLYYAIGEAQAASKARKMAEFALGRVSKTEEVLETVTDKVLDHFVALENDIVNVTQRQIQIFSENAQLVEDEDVSTYLALTASRLQERLKASTARYQEINELRSRFLKETERSP